MTLYYLIEQSGTNVEAVGPYPTENIRNESAECCARHLGRHAIDNGVTQLIWASVDVEGNLTMGTYLQSEIDEWFAAKFNDEGKEKTQKAV